MTADDFRFWVIVLAFLGSAVYVIALIGAVILFNPQRKASARIDMTDLRPKTEPSPKQPAPSWKLKPKKSP